jgi:hypothetical protein
MKTYTHPVRPGRWHLLSDYVSRSGRCTCCNDHIEVEEATFENVETREQVRDRRRLCSCDNSYDYSFKEEVHA